MRRKSEYVESINDKGKKEMVKVGTKEVQRDGWEYEFTLSLAIGANHFATRSKDRTGLFDDDPFLITAETGEKIRQWCNSGAVPSIDRIAELMEESKTDNKKFVEYFKVKSLSHLTEEQRLDAEKMLLSKLN